MAIIYTYPTVSSVAQGDKLLLSKASDNSTKQTTVEVLKDGLGVIDTITASSPIQAVSGNHSVALSLTTVPTNLGGTGLTTIGSAGQFLVVNQAGNGLEYISQTSIDGSGTANYLPIFTDSNTLGDSVMSQASNNLDLVIPQYIQHEADAGSKFGFNTDDGFLVYLGGTGATERLQLQSNSFILRVGDSTKISTNSTNASLYYEPSGTNTSHITLTSQLDGALLKGETGVNPGRLRLYNQDANAYVGLRGSSTQGSTDTYNLEMPPTLGSLDQVLSLSSVNPGGYSSLQWVDASGSPGGADTELQYKNGGSFGGTTGLEWDNTNNILSIETRFEGDIDGAVLQQVIAAEALSKGDVVYISGGTGDNPEVSKAQANSPSTMAALGIMKDNTNVNAIGECVTSGEITGLNLTGFTTGDELFVSNTTAGRLLTSAPTGEGNLIQKIGKVIKGGSGGALTVLGAFRTNATPNLDQGSLFIGGASNQSETLAIGSNNTILKSNGTTASWQTESNLANADQTLTGQRDIIVGSNQLVFTAPSPVGSSQVRFEPKTTFAETASFQSKISPGQHLISGTSGSIVMNPADGMVQKLTLSGNATFSIGLGASNGDEFTLIVTRTSATANITWSGITWDNNDTDPNQTNIVGRYDIYKIIRVDANNFGRVAALNYPVSA